METIENFRSDRKTLLETIYLLDCLDLLFYWNESYFVINFIVWLGTSVVTRSYCYPKTVQNVADIARWNSMLIIVLRLSKTFRSSWSLCEVINCFSCHERNIFDLPDSKLFWVYSNAVDALRKYIGIIVIELLQTASVSILVFHFCN